MATACGANARLYVFATVAVAAASLFALPPRRCRTARLFGARRLARFRRHGDRGGRGHRRREHRTRVHHRYPGVQRRQPRLLQGSAGAIVRPDRFQHLRPAEPAIRQSRVRIVRFQDDRRTLERPDGGEPKFPSRGLVYAGDVRRNADPQSGPDRLHDQFQSERGHRSRDQRECHAELQGRAAGVRADDFRPAGDRGGHGRRRLEPPAARPGSCPATSGPRRRGWLHAGTACRCR